MGIIVAFSFIALPVCIYLLASRIHRVFMEAKDQHRSDKEQKEETSNNHKP